MQKIAQLHHHQYFHATVVQANLLQHPVTMGGAQGQLPAHQASHQAAHQASHQASQQLAHQQGPHRRQQSLTGAAYPWAGLPHPPVNPQMQQAWNAAQEPHMVQHPTWGQAGVCKVKGSGKAWARKESTGWCKTSVGARGGCNQHIKLTRDCLVFLTGALNVTSICLSSCQNTATRGQWGAGAWVLHIIAGC